MHPIRIFIRKRNAIATVLLYNASMNAVRKEWPVMQNLVSGLLANFPGAIVIVNVLDIAIIAFAIYKILEIMQGTRAMPLAKGIAILLVFSALSSALGLTTVNWVLVQLQTMFIIAIPVIFAPELRRALEQLGTSGFLMGSRHRAESDVVDRQVQEIIGCMTACSQSRTGILIAVTRENGLKEYIATGIAINGRLSTPLLRNIFIVNTPLHDGAVIVTGNEIMAASCFLPLSENKNISMKLGTRHRAAIGLSEVSDAVVAVVSEETGAMSIAERGRLHYNLSEQEVIDEMTALLSAPEDASLLGRLKRVFHK